MLLDTFLRIRLKAPWPIARSTTTRIYILLKIRLKNFIVKLKDSDGARVTIQEEKIPPTIAYRDLRLPQEKKEELSSEDEDYRIPNTMHGTLVICTLRLLLKLNVIIIFQNCCDCTR